MARKSILKASQVNEDTLQDADNNTKVMVEKNANENKIRFDTAGTERMIIDETGKVGIGVASPTSPLHVYGNLDGTYVATIDNDENTNGHVLKLSTDGNGSGSRILEMEDGDGDIVFRARADGRFGFGPDGVSSMGAGTFVVGIDNSSHTADIAISQRLQHLGDSNTYMDFPANDQISFTAGGVTQLEIDNDAIHVAQYIRHIGDTNTHINFTDDKIILKAGNISMITMEEKASAPHDVRINNGGNNIDFVVEDNSGDTLLMTDADTTRVGINTASPAETLDVNGIAKATSVRTGLIEYTDGDDAITISDGGYLKFNAGIKYAKGVLVSSASSPQGSGGNQDGGWIKFATFSCPGTSGLDTAVSTFLITICGMESSNNRVLDGTFIVTAKFTNNNNGTGTDNASISNAYYEPEGTYIYCEPLNADRLSASGVDDFDPSTDLLMIFPNNTSTPDVDLYIRANAKTKRLFATHLGGTGQTNTFDTDIGWTINTGQSWSATEPATPANNVKITGTWASKVFSKLDVYGDTSVGGKIGIMVESSTPSQPLDGEGYIYSKSDGKLYWRSHDIAEVDLTAAGGGGGGGDNLSLTALKTSNYTAANWEMVLVNLVGASGDVTVTLPAASSNKQVAVKIAGLAMGKEVIVDGNSSETIDGLTTRIMNTDYESMHLISDGSNWWRIS